jgi:hypothetical protein
MDTPRKMVVAPGNSRSDFLLARIAHLYRPPDRPRAAALPDYGREKKERMRLLVILQRVELKVNIEDSAM